MRLSDVINALESFSEEELKRVNAAAVAGMNRYHHERQRVAAARFHVGDRVTFMSRRGPHVTGKITKINMVTAQLRANDGVLWKVSTSLLVKEIA